MEKQIARSWGSEQKVSFFCCFAFERILTIYHQVTKAAQESLSKSKEGEKEANALPVGSQRVSEYNLDLEESSSEEEETAEKRFGNSDVFGRGRRVLELFV